MWNLARTDPGSASQIFLQEPGTDSIRTVSCLRSKTSHLGAEETEDSFHGVLEYTSQQATAFRQYGDRPVLCATALAL
jgi:hypothetical protein